MKTKQAQPEQCANCKFYDSYSEPDDPSKHGDCRRYPPVAVDTFIDDDGFTRPMVLATDWCGEWAPVKKSPIKIPDATE